MMVNILATTYNSVYNCICLNKNFSSIGFFFTPLLELHRADDALNVSLENFNSTVQAALGVISERVHRRVRFMRSEHASLNDRL